MAGNKQVPLMMDGEQVGTVTIDENGLLMGDIWVDHEARVEIFENIKGLPISHDVSRFDGIPEHAVRREESYAVMDSLRMPPFAYSDVSVEVSGGEPLKAWVGDGIHRLDVTESYLEWEKTLPHKRKVTFEWEESDGG